MRGFAGDVFEPAVGELRVVRGFRLRDDGTLIPMAQLAHREWTGGVNEAQCGAGHDHDVPSDECRCGFYAYFDPARIDHHFVLRTSVVGVISVWGRTIVGSLGVRAQFARIEALLLPKYLDAQLVEAVRERYPSVRIYRGDSPDRMLADLPPSAPPGRRALDLRPTNGLTFVAREAAIVAALIACQLLAFLSFPAIRGGFALFVRVLIDVALMCLVLAGARRLWPRSRLIALRAPSLFLLVGSIALFVSDPSAPLAVLPLAVACCALWRIGRRLAPPPAQVTVHAHTRATARMRALRSTAWTVAPARSRFGGVEIVSQPFGGGRSIVYWRPRHRIGRSRVAAALRVGLPTASVMLRASRRGLAACLIDVSGGQGVDVNLLRKPAQSLAVPTDEVVELLNLPPEAVGRSGEWLDRSTIDGPTLED